MRHGIDAYFDEISRFQRRLAAFGVGVSVLVLVLLLVLQQPVIVDALSDPKRFGYEGPDQYVERILLEMQGPEEQIGANVMNAAPMNRREGGGKRKSAEEGMKPAPTGPKVGQSSGDDEMTLEARLRALALAGPIVQSEDLVVEKMVRPEYPEEARDQDIEGMVELIALVDTTGSVVQVEIIGGSRQPLLELAASSAVLQCRYRPYRVREDIEPVWAYFRITFRLY
jgi:TonB family protein